MIAKQFNLFLLRYGSLLHTIFLSLILYGENIHPNTFIYWVFLLNHVMFSYFVFIRGMALGISKTIDIIANQEATKSIQNDINRNN